MNAGHDIGNSGRWLGELDCDIGIAKCAACDAGAIAVVFLPEHRREVPAALLHHLPNRPAHLPVTDDRDRGLIHLEPLPKNSSCSRRIAGCTLSALTITVRLMPVALRDIM